MDLSAVYDVVEALRAQLSVPAVCIAAVGRERTLTSMALGPSTSPSSVFAAASLTKPVFAAAVLRLAASGRIDLDVPLVEYAPGPLRLRDASASEITARLVLSHRSGLANWPASDPPGLVAKPGTTFCYSGDAYDRLQHVLEAVLGHPLETWLRSLVLEPAGMHSSALAWHPDLASRFAGPHDSEARPMPRAERAAAAAGTLFTTALDYVRFLAFLFRERSLLDRMIQPHTDVAPGIGWGLGWALSDGLAFHWGDDPGYKHLVVLDPVRPAALVVLTNSDAGWKVYARATEALFPGSRLLEWLLRAYAPDPRSELPIGG